jgi:hypothetical protein
MLPINQPLNSIQQLSTSLQALQPSQSETTQLITYTLLATALVGLFIYHYIKNQENLDGIN